MHHCVRVCSNVCVYIYVCVVSVREQIERVKISFFLLVGSGDKTQVSRLGGKSLSPELFC